MTLVSVSDSLYLTPHETLKWTSLRPSQSYAGESSKHLQKNLKGLMFASREKVPFIFRVLSGVESRVHWQMMTSRQQAWKKNSLCVIFLLTFPPTSDPAFFFFFEKEQISLFILLMTESDTLSFLRTNTQTIWFMQTLCSILHQTLFCSKNDFCSYFLVCFLPI